MPKRKSATAQKHETEERVPESGESVVEPLDLDEAKMALGEASNKVDQAETDLASAKTEFAEAAHSIGAWLAGKGKHAVVEVDGKQWSSKLVRNTGTKEERDKEGNVTQEAVPPRFTLVRHYERNVVG